MRTEEGISPRCALSAKRTRLRARTLPIGRRISEGITAAETLMFCVAGDELGKEMPGASTQGGASAHAPKAAKSPRATSLCSAQGNRRARLRGVKRTTWHASIPYQRKRKSRYRVHTGKPCLQPHQDVRGDGSKRNSNQHIPLPGIPLPSSHADSKSPSYSQSFRPD